MAATQETLRIVILGAGETALAQAKELQASITKKTQLTLVAPGPQPDSDLSAHGFDIIYGTRLVSSVWNEARQVHALTWEPATSQCGASAPTSAHFLIHSLEPWDPVYAFTPPLENLSLIPHVHASAFDPATTLTGKRVIVVGNGQTGSDLVARLSEDADVTVTHIIKAPRYYVRESSPLLWRGDRAATAAAGKSLAAAAVAAAPSAYTPLLSPSFPFGADLTVRDNGYLAALNRPNVTLVKEVLVGARAGSTTPASAIPAALTTASGRSYPADLVIFATGSTAAATGLGLETPVTGRDGAALPAPGAAALRGVAVPGIPNYLITLGPHALAGDWISTIASQTRFVAALVSKAAAQGYASITPTRTAAEAYTTSQQAALAQTTLTSSFSPNALRARGTGRVTVAAGDARPILDWHEWTVVAVDARTAELVRVDAGRLALQAAALRGGLIVAVLATVVASVVRFTGVRNVGLGLGRWLGRD